MNNETKQRAGDSSRMISFRPQIKVFDATVRDGGLVNDFFFTDEFVKDLYDTNVSAGVDFMEFGYKADRDLFDESKFGKWKFCKEDDIWNIIGEKKEGLAITAMADVGRCNYQRDIGEKANSPIDMYRIATYIHTMPAAIAMIEHCHKLGYKTTCNIMAISVDTEKDIEVALEMLGQSSVDGVYIVDSYGALYPMQIRLLAQKYLETGEKYGKEIGIHAHNNQNLAFANTIECAAAGVNYLDATYGAMGRGAGNCAMELLLGFLKNPKYNLNYALKFLEKHINALKKQGVVWGYDIQYLLTGILNQHPRTAIKFTSDKREDYFAFYQGILDRD